MLNRRKFTTLEKSLDYKFNDFNLLQEALSHPSLKQHNPNSINYERMEILGDAILGFLITEKIYKECKDISEGDIAKIKAHAVSKSKLSELGEQLNLADYIIMTHGEETSGGKKNINNIENALEALLAAIYLDSNINTIRNIVNKLWANSIQNINLHDVDPKSSLQEILQSHKLPAPLYKMVNQEGSAHEPIFTVEVVTQQGNMSASAKSKKEAEKEAARKMLKQLKAIN